MVEEGGPRAAAGVRRLTPEMRREQTRQYLMDAAAVIFAAKGYHATSLEEIAEAAGFTRGAIYANWSGKEELFIALVEQRQAQMIEQFFPAADPLAHPDPDERLAAISEVYRRLTPTEAEYALWAEFELYALRNAELRQRIAEQNATRFVFIVDLVKRQLADLGVTKPQIAPEVLAHLFVAVFDSLARQRALDPSTVPDDLFGTIVSFLNDAVVATAKK